MSIQILMLMNNNEFKYEENLAAGHLQSYLIQNEIEANLCYLNTDFEHHYEKIFDQTAILYAFALTESNIISVFIAIKKLKIINPKAVICVFDAFANYNCRNILLDNSQIDFIPFGSANKTIHYVYSELCKGRQLSQLKSDNLMLSNTPLNDVKYLKNVFNDYVWADRENLKKRNVIIAHIISSYGCSARCSFCTMPQLDNSVSFRNVNDVFNEIVSIYTKYNIRFFHFNDASFEGGGKFGKERMKQICELLIDYPIKFGFRCFVRADSFKNNDDEIYLKLLKKAGFNNIFVGIESGNNADLSCYNKRSTVHDNEHFLNICKKNDINPFYGFVMINPYSTQDTINDNFDFLIRHKSDQLSHYTNCLQIYSNTKIFERISNDNLLYHNYDYKQPPFQYNCMDSGVNEIKTFLQTHFYNHIELQKWNSTYHNFIFLNNYLKSIGIFDERIQEKFCNISRRLFDILKGYFSYLYIKKDLNTCANQNKELINEILSIYSGIEPMKEKMLKLYYKSFLDARM